MALVSIPVLTVQKGLAVYHGLGPRPRFPQGVPSPGAVDGRWGQRTSDALVTFIRNDATPRFQGDPQVEIARLSRFWPSSTPTAAITLEQLIAADLTQAAAQYRGSSSVAPRAAEQEPMALVAPAAFPWTAVLLGLGAAVLVVGGGYLLFRKGARWRS